MKISVYVNKRSLVAFLSTDIAYANSPVNDLHEFDFQVCRDETGKHCVPPILFLVTDTDDKDTLLSSAGEMAIWLRGRTPKSIEAVEVVYPPAHMVARH